MFTHFNETVNIKLLRSKWYFKPYIHAQSGSSLASRWGRQPWYLKTRRNHLIMVAVDVLALFRRRSISNHEPYWLAADCDYIVTWTIFLHIYIAPQSLHKLGTTQVLSMAILCMDIVCYWCVRFLRTIALLLMMWPIFTPPHITDIIFMAGKMLVTSRQ